MPLPRGGDQIPGWATRIDCGEEKQMMYGWYGPMGPVGLISVVIVMMLFWTGLIAAIVVGVRSVRACRIPGHSPGGSGEATLAEQLLAQRLARGDIDEETYLHQRDLIRSR
jgi:putative membrane protein